MQIKIYNVKASLPEEIAELVARRVAARRARDWYAADLLRDVLRDRGYDVEDLASGTVVRPSLR
jgi:cysteinyl-tRNA synthetase